MALFDGSQAAYFFRAVPAGAPSPSSYRDWLSRQRTGAIFTEGGLQFEELRIHSHREAERLLLLAASHFRRAHDSMSTVSSPWALVTIYYGAFFAASGLLGMLGAWKLRDNLYLQVTDPSPGSQRFELQNGTSTYRGSHQKFWEFYFRNATGLIASANAAERFALNPISSDVTWLISRRNDVNYDTYRAKELATAHRSSFSVASFPSSLSGALSTQYRFLDSLLLLTNRIAGEAGVNSDAVSDLALQPRRSDRVRQLVLTEATPKLGSKVRRKTVTG